MLIVLSSVDQLIPFKKGKATRSPLKHPQGIPADRGICWREEKYALSKILQAFPLSENLPLLMENRVETFKPAHAAIRCWLWRVCQWGRGLQSALDSRRSLADWEMRFYIRVSKKGDLFLKDQWPVARWRYLCKGRCYCQWELLVLNKSDIQAVSLLQI